MQEDRLETPRGGWRDRRRLVVAGAAVAVVAFAFAFVLPRIADYRDVWDVLQTLGWQEALVLAGATAINLVTFPPPWMAALPGIGFRQAFMLSQASTALSLVSPAGAAVGMAGSYSMLRSWGFERASVALAVAVTGIWNQLSNFAFPIVGFALLTSAKQDHPALRTTAFVGIVIFIVVVCVFALALQSRRRAVAIGDLAARLVNRVYGLIRLERRVSGKGESVARFRQQALQLLRRRWHVLTAATLAGHLGVFLVLLACVETVGNTSAQITWIEAFAAWSLVRVLGAIPFTPGGLGFVELGLSGALVAFGAGNADAVAVTLLYRALTIVPTLALGMLAAATWRTHHPAGRLERGVDDR
ncbi:MAG: flippase-like domain-containing protein [Actinobacteria bacterium]|nr:flippase-like domain-containing protein [Actinomycetota bacterium]